jgi:hypothetical protein
MRFRIAIDAAWEARLSTVTDVLFAHELRQFIESKEYGEGMAALSIVLMCRGEEFAFKRRIKFLKKDRDLQMDIMLDLDVLKHASREERIRIVVDRLILEVPQVVRSYDIKPFDSEAFISDFVGKLREILAKM